MFAKIARKLTARLAKTATELTIALGALQSMQGVEVDIRVMAEAEANLGEARRQLEVASKALAALKAPKKAAA